MVSRSAADTYKMWHQKAVRDVVDMPFVLPRRLSRLGAAARVVYESDKWEADGDIYPYQHEFTSRPDMFVANPQGEVDVRDFLDMDNLDDFELNWIHLGCVTEMRLSLPEKQRKTKLVFPEEPLMCCTAECDTLIILHTELLFVRGGTMRITERGIVD